MKINLTELTDFGAIHISLDILGGLKEVELEKGVRYTDPGVCHKNKESYEKMAILFSVIAPYNLPPIRWQSGHISYRKIYLYYLDIYDKFWPTLACSKKLFSQKWISKGLI